jgi:integrase
MLWAVAPFRIWVTNGHKMRGIVFVAVSAKIRQLTLRRLIGPDPQRLRSEDRSPSPPYWWWTSSRSPSAALAGSVLIGALETCSRQGEMLRIQNRHVDWEQHQIDLHWHDLRPEGACRLLSDGVDIPTIQLMLGHAEIKQTQRYLNITDEELRKAMTGVRERRCRLRAVGRSG